jgi:glycosyltransferase involved in cell wall biosynthesis
MSQAVGVEGLRVSLVLGTSTGGIGRHVLSLARALHARGADVTVYGPAATDAQFGFGASGIGFRPLEIPTSLRLTDVRTATALRRALRGEPAGGWRVDVLHAHGLRAGLIAGLTRPPAMPLVVTWHNTVLGDGMRARALRAGERYVARAADVTLGASEDLVERAIALGGRDVRLGAVAAPPVPVATRPPVAVRAELGATGRPLVISVGRLHPQKGYDTLVAAAARWRGLDRPPVVAIAGTGPSYRDLAARISAARAPVLLLGHRGDIGDLLGAADLAVVSSVWEARQLFAQEAMRAGVPLVATGVGGLPGLVGDAAVLVPPGDVDALDEAVRRLLADPALRARYAAAGSARAATWPTEEDTVAQVAAVYAELTGRAPAAVARPADQLQTDQLQADQLQAEHLQAEHLQADQFRADRAHPAEAGP